MKRNPSTIATVLKKAKAKIKIKKKVQNMYILARPVWFTSNVEAIFPLINFFCGSKFCGSGLGITENIAATILQPNIILSIF